ncbi:MAG: hypothetical protein MJ252_28020 [archaeon]|nr:hypothetical protein [archaeon]
MSESSDKSLPKYIMDELIANLYLFGLIKKSDKEGIMTHVPIGFTPSPIPESFFNKISFYQIAFNKILDKLSKDQTLLEEILTPIAEKNEFIQKCLEISKKAAAFENKSKVNLAFLRNDYMVDKNKKFIFLNDIKTLNFSLFSYSDKLKAFFQYFIKKYNEEFKKVLGESNIEKLPLDKADTVPTLAKSMIDAIKIIIGGDNENEYKKSLIVFVINPNNKMDFELKTLENYLYDNYEIRVKYMTLAEVPKQCTKDDQGIIKTEDKRISLFYFATGNSQNDYQEEGAWNGREMIELSNAVKCPSINLFLVSLEVFKNKLRDTEFIKKFITEELIINDMLRFFSQSNFIRDLPEDKQKEVLGNLFKNKEGFYVKNLRKDNESLFAGEKILTVIPSESAELTEDIKNLFVLEKIDSPDFDCTTIKEEKEAKIKGCSCFSVFGIIMSDATSLTVNKALSFLVRTLPKEEIQGEIFDNLCYLSLPLLVDMKISKDDVEPIKY